MSQAPDSVYGFEIVAGRGRGWRMVVHIMKWHCAGSVCTAGQTIEATGR